MDLARIGHIGVEALVVGGGAFLLMQQNKALQEKVDELQKQLAHVALHTRNVTQGLEGKLTALSEEIERLKKGRERPPRAREILRATTIKDLNEPEDLDRPAPRPRSRRLPPQEPSSPPPPPPASTPPRRTPPPEDDEESDVETLLRRSDS